MNFLLNNPQHSSVENDTALSTLPYNVAKESFLGENGA